MIKSINKLFQQRSNLNFAQKKLKLIGQKILDETYKEIRSYL